MKLRKELGLQQKEFAARCGLKLRTLQDIERGLFRLSRQKAFLISGQTGVSAEWLLKNDLKSPMTNFDGRVWSQKDRQRATGDFKRVLRALKEMGPRAEEAAIVLAVPWGPALFDHYLTVRAFFRKARGEPELLKKWHECHQKAWRDFVAASGYSPGKATEHLNHAELESIRDDIDYVQRWLNLEPRHRLARKR